MGTLRTIASLLVASLVVAGSWLMPVASTAIPNLDSSSLRSLSPGKLATPNVRPSKAFAAPAATVIDDAVILLDVTGSMRGEGPDPRVRNIWEKTVVAVTDIVDRLALQTNIALVPFSNGPEWRNTYPGPLSSGAKLTASQLASNADRQAFKAHLWKLAANGEVTWIYESLEYSLAQLRLWREADPGRTHRQALYLYTDGIDNGPHGQLGIDGLVQLIRANKANYPDLYLVYNDLASYLTPEQKAQLADIGVTVTVGPPASNVELVTDSLDFGELSTSGSSGSRSIAFRSGFADVWGKSIRLRLVDGGSGLPVSLTTEITQLREQLTVGINATGPLSAGQHQARLAIEPVDGAFNLIPRNSLELTFSFIPAPAPAAAPAPEPIVTAPSRQSLIEGVSDPLLFLGILALVFASAVVAMWQQELWPFKGAVPTMQLIWKRGDDPTESDEEGVRIRTIKPRKSRSSEHWKIGIEGYISLPEGVLTIKPSHAKITYNGKRQRDFRVVPVEGEVQTQSRTLDSSGMAIRDGSTFEIGPYHFRFEAVTGADQSHEA